MTCKDSTEQSNILISILVGTLNQYGLPQIQEIILVNSQHELKE
jgi:hypothetical protein